MDNFQRKYYVEWRVSGGGGLQKDWGGPTVGSTKHYYIELPSSSWRAGVSGVFTKTFSYTNSARDYQAYTETSSSEVKIDGTRFSYLSYRQNNDWILWYRHVPNVDNPPYYLIEKSHYEFEAYGGGGGG
ncbi:hypothetical protein KEJ21_03420 [Candidatus Bathyarchaeota archaeon]|nr:hypothetical protein [Candidatus Bathyarchaeota archaeon]MBS7630767.1 hypothetical protein [Candidatus Bathyarchaeota archaeon]